MKDRVRKVFAPALIPEAPGVVDELCRAGLADSYKLFTVCEV